MTVSMTTLPRFRLKVRSVEQVCFFELSDQDNRELSAQVPYPQTVMIAYHRWRQAYLHFYQSLRAKVKGSGGINVTDHCHFDWRKQLAQAEAELLSEFYEWLSHGKLLEIRETLSQAAFSVNQTSAYVDVFLTCYSDELARLPWEAWEISIQPTAKTTIRLARTPANMRAETKQYKPRRKTRILVISGDDTGLNFQKEKQEIKSLGKKNIEVKLVGFKENLTTQSDNFLEQLKEKIFQEIADELGWDILIFMGHSNETKLTGGELAIAPHTGILITELLPYLKAAQKRGLQFALFNSCEGLTIANTLIDVVGLNQVAVMREPIHNKVAEEFLICFFRAIKNYKDVHEAILSTCEQLKKAYFITYPSSYLIPALFRHPDTPLFQLKPLGFRPTLREIIILLIFIFLSLLPTENLLLYPRLWMQAFYRDLTQQLTPTSPSVLLVQIDEETIQKEKIAATKVHPIDRVLLAKIIQNLLLYQPNVIGIDYILDRPSANPQEDLAFQKVVNQAVKQKTWLVFAAIQDLNNYSESNVVVAPPEVSLKGYIDFTDSVVEQLPPQQLCEFSCPFSYLLALSSLLQPEVSNSFLSPQNNKDFRRQVLALSQQKIQNKQASPALQFLQKYLNQSNGLQPIIDFSIPPEQVYDTVAAWKLLEQSSIPVTDKFLSSNLSQKIPIIAPGGYEEAGVFQGEDTFPIPLPMSYWRRNTAFVTGAEFHAYMIHHWLNQHFVWQVPSLWLVPLAALLGKVTTLVYPNERDWFWQGILVSGGSGLLSLQLLISAHILFPWLLPSLLYWIYILPSSKEKLKWKIVRNS